MSEFQIYQFKSIDRPLTDAERKEIGSWSTRTNLYDNICDVHIFSYE